MSQIQQVKDATDLVAIIGERIQLQRSGSNLRALCPFHSEKSPSFFVNEALQRYRCFGCGKSGDALQFLQDYEGMTFAEALQVLAEKGGVKLQEFKPSVQDTQREQLLALLDLAKEYYRYILTNHKQGQVARDYLKQRGVTTESGKLFQLGFAVESWDGLIKYLNGKKHYSMELLEEAGLVVKGRGGRYYDRFRNRIMFPLKNHRGQVVGFSGRVLQSDAKEAKYINSPETMLYHKAKLLFGYSELFQEIRKQAAVVVVEGELDVISSVQAHVNHIVAVKGSALTKDQAQLLSRSVKTVILALDSDAAGREATRRAIEVVKEFDLDLRVVVMPTDEAHAAKDPDELARSDPKAWREAAKRTVSAYEFLIQAAFQDFDPATPTGKRKIIQAVGPIISSVEHAVERDFYIHKVAVQLQVKESLVREDLELLQRKQQAKSVTQLRRVSAESPPENQPQTQTSEKKSNLNKRGRLERYLWFLLLQFKPADIPDRLEALSQLFAGKHERAFSSPSLQALLLKAQAFLKKTSSAQPQPQLQLRNFSSSLDADLQQTIFDLLANPEFVQAASHFDLAKEWTTSLKQLHDFLVVEEVTVITEELNRLDTIENKSPTEEARQQELLAKITLLKRG